MAIGPTDRLWVLGGWGGGRGDSGPRNGCIFHIYCFALDHAVSEWTIRKFHGENFRLKKEIYGGTLCLRLLMSLGSLLWDYISLLHGEKFFTCSSSSSGIDWLIDWLTIDQSIDWLIDLNAVCLSIFFVLFCLSFLLTWKCSLKGMFLEEKEGSFGVDSIRVSKSSVAAVCTVVALYFSLSFFHLFSLCSGSKRQRCEHNTSFLWRKRLKGAWYWDGYNYW